MKIYSALSFRGVKPEHSENGYTIKPIYKDYKLSELQAMVNSIEPKNYLGSGKNGHAYAIGKDIVIKQTREDSIVPDAVLVEAEKLDMFYEMEKNTKLDLQNSQKGYVAFKTPDKNSYLISTRVPGGYPSYEKNPLNKKNLLSMIKIITTLDKGVDNRFRILPYDFSGDNINFTKKRAGLLDFEYMEQEDIVSSTKGIKNTPNFWSISCHISDTSLLNSSLRSFEQNCFHYYLNNMPEDEAKELFRQYLNQKSKYHKSMSKYYAKLSKIHKEASQEFIELSKKEKNHAKILGKRNIDLDVVQAEAIKIQMAFFLNKMYDAINNVGKISPEQIGKFYSDSLKYIQESLKEAIHIKDKEKARYFCDCKTIMSIWRFAPDIARVWIKKSHKTKNYIQKTLDMIVR